jgi:PPK2 family polyphosphate:nucleotide phosphotransferase
VKYSFLRYPPRCGYGLNYSERFRVEEGSKVKLGEIDPGYKGEHEDKATAQAELEKGAQRLGELQYLMYAENTRSLLIILQGMEAAGKDGTISHVMAAMNPQGCRVYEFGVPLAKELAPDYLWRGVEDISIDQALPRKGYITIFNCSYYDAGLAVRVHNLVSKEVWSRRYDEINNFEKLLVDNGTHIIKFFLHIDKEEQLARFRQRIDDPDRLWKISESDYREREYWNDYEKAYEDAISKCSTKHAPWYIIPSNHKWFRNLAVSQTLVDALESLNMKFPAPTVSIAEIKRKYHKAVAEDTKS